MERYYYTYEINVREYRRGNKKMDIPEKLATQDTQDENKNQVFNRK